MIAMSPEPSTQHAVRRWLAILRIPAWVHFVALPWAGYDPQLPMRTQWWALGRGSLIAFFILAFGYLLNSIADRHMDESLSKNPLRHQDSGIHSLQYLVVGLGIVALLVSVTAHRIVWAATALALLSGSIYSTGPRLKAMPIVGTVLNVFCFAPLLFVGIPTPAWPAHMGILVAGFVLLLLQNQLIHEGADHHEDRQGGIRTTWVTLGYRYITWILSLLGIIFFIYLLSTAVIPRWSSTVLGFGSAILFPWLVNRSRGHGPVLAKTRWFHRLFSLLAGCYLFFQLKLSFFSSNYLTNSNIYPLACRLLRLPLSLQTTPCTGK
jgi:4-hydroxybenzoate polyprenyltransferase